MSLLGLYMVFDCEIENTFKGSVMRLDLLVLVENVSGVLVPGLAFILLARFTCEIIMRIKRDFPTKCLFFYVAYCYF